MKYLTPFFLLSIAFISFASAEEVSALSFNNSLNYYQTPQSYNLYNYPVYNPGNFVSLTARANKSVITLDEDITYTISLVNNFNQPVVVQVSNQFPNGVRFVSSRPSITYIQSNAVVFSNVTILPRQNYNITVKGKLVNYPGSAGSITNTVKITGGETVKVKTNVVSYLPVVNSVYPPNYNQYPYYNQYYSQYPYNQQSYYLQNPYYQYSNNYQIPTNDGRFLKLEISKGSTEYIRSNIAVIDYEIEVENPTVINASNVKMIAYLTPNLSVEKVLDRADVIRRQNGDVIEWSIHVPADNKKTYQFSVRADLYNNYYKSNAQIRVEIPEGDTDTITSLISNSNFKYDYYRQDNDNWSPRGLYFYVEDKDDPYYFNCGQDLQYKIIINNNSGSRTLPVTVDLDDSLYFVSTDTNSFYRVTGNEIRFSGLPVQADSSEEIIIYTRGKNILQDGDVLKTYVTVDNNTKNVVTAVEKKNNCD